MSRESPSYIPRDLVIIVDPHWGAGRLESILDPGAGPDLFADRGGQFGQRGDRNLETNKTQAS